MASSCLKKLNNPIEGLYLFASVAGGSWPSEQCYEQSEGFPLVEELIITQKNAKSLETICKRAVLFKM